MTTDLYIDEIMQGEMTENDIRWLAKADATTYDGTRGVDLAAAWLTGSHRLFRIRGKAEGILVCSIQSKLPRTLFVDFIAGKGLLRFFGEIVEWLKAFAYEEQCEAVELMAASSLRAALGKRHGFTQVAVLMRL